MSHAMLPTPLLRPDRITVFVAGCDRDMRGRVFRADLARTPPYDLLSRVAVPVIDVGDADSPDADGINPSCLIKADGRLWMYTICWRRWSADAPYTLIAGLAISDDGGDSWTKHPEPILPPSPAERYFRTAPHVFRDPAGFGMLYIGGGEFFDGPDGKRLPLYSLCAARSSDGLHWPGEGQVLLAPDVAAGEIGFGRPVLRRGADGAQTLLISVRRVDGYALLELDWAAAQAGRRVTVTRLDPGEAAWESEMTCFGAPLVVGDEELLFYNGNGFGRSGFGLATRPFG